MFYRAICDALYAKRVLYPLDKHPREYVKGGPLKEYYSSIFKYNEEHKKRIEETGSASGIQDVKTNWLVFDFDYDKDKEISKNEAIELARQDTIKVCARLVEEYDFEEDTLNIFFSGSKGFHIEIHLDEDVELEQFKLITRKIGGEFDTFDRRIHDPQRIFRLANTVNKKTGLYKTKLTSSQLVELNIEQIRELSKVASSELSYKVSKLPDSVKKLLIAPEEPKLKLKLRETSIDWLKRPKDFPPCRWAIYNGEFKPGERHEALMSLVAYFKFKGETAETAYHRGLGAIELQAKKNDCEEYDKKEFYDTCVKSIYSADWKGGQYTCREKDSWLGTFCASLGNNKCDHKEEDSLKPRKLADIQVAFKDYVTNIEKNTIKTGLKSLDEKIFLSTGANVGVIGAPGSGKTSIALDILNNTSKAGVHSVFASLDMHSNRLFEKVLYRVSGKHRDELYDIFKNDGETEIMESLNREFGNVHFFHKSAPSVANVRDYIKACEDNSGEKVKLVMLDYFERVNSDVGDDTAASKKIAGELQDLVNDLNVCLITLVQPNKMSLSGGPDTPITSYTSIKGSSFVYQAFRIIFSIWRPFYNPKDFSNDQYMQMAVLKNDLGELAELNFGWNGKRGLITELEYTEEQHLREMLKFRQQNQDQKVWG